MNPLPTGDFAAIGREVAEDPSDDTLVLFKLWRRMLLIRRHEEAVEHLNDAGHLRGSSHLYIGMEAGATGVASALRAGDRVNGYYRCHGHALALGMDPRVALAEILGRRPGCARGRAGSKHLMDVSLGYYGAHAIVGQQVPIAVGLGLDLKLRHVPLDHVAVCFLGDGAVNQGVTMEALNLAAALEVPCLFVCENNRYAVSSPASKMLGGGSFVRRAAGFGIEGERVDGMDVRAVREAALRAREHCVTTGRPFALELDSYRFRGHSVFIAGEGYRSSAELEEMRARDPLSLAGRALEKAGYRDAMEDAEGIVKKQLDEAVAWALQQEPAEIPRPSDMYATTPVVRD